MLIRFNYLFMLSIFQVASIVPVVFASEYSMVLQEMEIPNNFGKEVALAKFNQSPIIVFAFLGTECPLARLYGPRLDAIANEYADQGVTVLGIFSNRQDTLSELTAYANRYKISFPILKDIGNQLADVLEARRTPEVFVLDQLRNVRYRGRIDDQYGIGYSREHVDRSELKLAINQLLTGKKIDIPETEPVGCIIGRVKEVNLSGDITYTKHIAPILNKHCVSCHRPNEIGPFTLSNYDDIQGWEEMILEVIEQKRMPPWSANPNYGHFKNDPRLSVDEIELIRNWITTRMPEGDLNDLPEPPIFTDGWGIPKPDQVINMNEEDEAFTIPSDGIVDYQRFLIDPGWEEDKYIYAAEARPQNRSVVHHILVYVVDPKKKKKKQLERVLVGYAPGTPPMNLADGMAMHVPAGSQLLFEMHYTPNGSVQTDLSYAGVCFLNKEDVKQIVKGRAIIDHEFEIPPYASNHEVKARPYVARKDQYLLTMLPHMHLRGKSFRYEAHYPDGTREILLDVPQYDFNWQLEYSLAEPKFMPKGTKLFGTAVYDNSEKNLTNPEPGKSVSWGDQSWDEMMLGFFTTVPSLPEATD